MATRRTREQINAERNMMVELMKEGKPELEILDILGISPIQFQKYLADAVKRKEIQNWEPKYDLIETNKLPAQIRDLLIENGTAFSSRTKILPSSGGIFLELIDNSKMQNQKS